MPQLFTNNARALLVTGIAAGDTSLTIEAGKADLFPSANVGTGAVPSTSNWFKATLQDAVGNTEIIYVRTRSLGSGIFSNVMRGQEGTTALAFTAGTVVGLRITAADIQASIGMKDLDNTFSGLNTFSQIIQGSISHPFPAGTRMPFAQASAPTGWTQDTSDNADNRMLRVVKTAGGGVAGTHSPILNNVVPSHTHGFTTGNVSHDHAHYVSGSTSGSGNHSHEGGTGVESLAAAFGRSGNGTGYRMSLVGNWQNLPYTSANGDHSHSLSAWTGGINSNHTHSGSTDNGSSQTNWQPRYIDLIICTKN